VTESESKRLISLEGPVLKSKTEQHKNIVIFIHGYGANGDDLIGLGSYWRNDLADTLFLSPHAPFACEEIPFGRQWFSLGAWDPSLYGTADVSQRVINGVANALPHLNAYIDQVLLHSGLQEDRLALVGFSQGAMMALSVAYSRKKPCAAVIGYSGGFTTGVPLEVVSPCPTLLVHGSEDAVIPVRAMKESALILKANGIPVETLECNNLGHSISDQGLQKGGRFLCEHFENSVTSVKVI
jgi:phospholipase/carboxylesterase